MRRGRGTYDGTLLHCVVLGPAQRPRRLSFPAPPASLGHDRAPPLSLPRLRLPGTCPAQPPRPPLLPRPACVEVVGGRGGGGSQQGKREGGRRGTGGCRWGTGGSLGHAPRPNTASPSPPRPRRRAPLRCTLTPSLFMRDFWLDGHRPHLTKEPHGQIGTRGWGRPGFVNAGLGRVAPLP